MSIYTTYFSSPIQVGKQIDNNQRGIGDVVLSQTAVAPITTAGAPAYIYLPTGSDLLAIDYAILNGIIVTGGVMATTVAQADGSSPGIAVPNTINVGSPNRVYDWPVVFNQSLANVYYTLTEYRLEFRCTTNLVFDGGIAPQLVVDIRYCIRA